jgi:hypothetical protein
MHRTLRLLMLGFLAILTACDKQPPATAPRYELVADVRQTMAFIIDLTADTIWDSAGSIITAAGE